MVSLNTFTNRLSLIPVAFVAPAVGPHFYSISLWLAFVPLAIIDLAVGKLALARKEARLFPFTFKDCAVREYFDSMASGFALDPAPIKRCAVRQGFLAHTVGLTFLPLAFIRTLIWIFADALPFRKTFFPISIKNSAIWQLFDSPALKKAV